MTYKRYQYWSSENGKPVKKFTDWFPWTGQDRPKYQLIPSLLNEYKEA